MASGFAVFCQLLVLLAVELLSSTGLASAVAGATEKGDAQGKHYRGNCQDDRSDYRPDRREHVKLLV